jgi:hypothetical protein
LATNSSQGFDLQTVLETHEIQKGVEPFVNFEVQTLEMPLYFGWYSRAKVLFDCPVLTRIIAENELVFRTRFHAIFG